MYIGVKNQGAHLKPFLFRITSEQDKLSFKSDVKIFYLSAREIKKNGVDTLVLSSFHIETKSKFEYFCYNPNVHFF